MKHSHVKIEIDNDGNPQQYFITVRPWEKAVIEYTIIDKRFIAEDEELEIELE